MKKVLLLLFVFTAWIYCKAQTITEKPYVHCLVLDKTASMEGKLSKGIFRPEENIWNKVKNYCMEWVDNIPENKSAIVLLFTYDKDLYGPQTFIIDAASVKSQIKDSIKGIKADGQFTYIATCLQKTIDYLDANYKDNNKRIYLITDGIDEDKNLKFADVVHKYGKWRGDGDFLYFVDLKNLADDEINAAFDETPGAVEGQYFTEFVTLTPDFKVIPHEIKLNQQNENSFKVKQLFTVSGRMTNELKIQAHIPDGCVNGANMNVSVENPHMNNDGKYEVEVCVNVLNGTLTECEIPVELTGNSVKMGNSTVRLILEPSAFNIKITKEKEVIKPVTPPTIEVVGDPWN